MNTEREFHIFPEKPISPEEIKQILPFLRGLYQIKETLHSEWATLLTQANLHEYIQDLFIQNSIDKEPLEQAISDYNPPSSTPSLEDDSLRGTESDRLLFSENSHENIANELQSLLTSPLEYEEEPDDSSSATVSRQRPTTIFNGFSPQRENDEDNTKKENSYVVFTLHVINKIQELPAPQLSFLLFQDENSKELTANKLICYLIRDIAYRLHEQLLNNPYNHPALDDIITRIHALAFQLKPENRGLSENMQTYQLHKACCSIALNNLLDLVKNNITSPATPPASRVISSSTSSSDDSDRDPLIKKPSSHSTPSSISTVSGEPYRPMPLWLELNFLQGHFLKKLYIYNPRIESLMASAETPFGGLKNILQNMGYYPNTPAEVTKLLLDSAQEFADISPAHTAVILEALLHTLPDLPFKELLRHHYLAAVAEWKHIDDILCCDSSSVESLLKAYLQVDPDNKIAKILNHILLCPREESLETNRKAIASLLSIIATQNRRDTLQHMLAILLKTSTTSDTSSNRRFSDILALEPTDLETELAYLNNNRIPPIPVRIFLQSYLAGIYSLPDICGITVAYFVFLLNHWETDIPKQSSSLHYAFKDYQNSVLAAKFGFEKNNIIMRKDSFFEYFLLSGNASLSKIKRQRVRESFSQVLLEVLENGQIANPSNSLILRHYYRLVLSYTAAQPQRIQDLIKQNSAYLPLFYSARDSSNWLNQASIEHINQLAEVHPDGNRYVVNLIFSWIQRQIRLQYLEEGTINHNSNKPLTPDEMATIYLCLRQNLDDMRRYNYNYGNTIIPEKLDTLLTKLNLFKEYQHLRGMGLLHSSQSSKKHIQETRGVRLSFLLMQKKEKWLTTEEYIIRCINYLLICDLTERSDRQLAVSILYPSHDRGEFYFTTQVTDANNEPVYHRIPSWMTIRDIQTLSIQRFITDLIDSIWNERNRASAAEFRFLIRVMISLACGETNIFTRALDNTKHGDDIKISFPEVLSQKIQREIALLEQHAKYIFFAAVQWQDDEANSYNNVNEVMINCLLYACATNSSEWTRSMRYFTSTINGRTVLGWNPLLQPLSQDQKKTFASKLAQVKQDYRDESYACNPTTRTEMVNFINQSITFLKANEVKKIPEYQLYSRDDYQHYLQKKDLLDDVFWASTIGVTDFFTHYLSGDDISEPIGLLDTLAFFPMLKMMNLIVDYYLLTHNIRNAQAESVHEAISLTPESLGRIAKSSHTLFAALGMIDLSASPDQTPRP